MKTEELEELEASNAERLAAVRSSRIELDAKKKEVVTSLKAAAAAHIFRGDQEKALRSCLDAHEIAPDDIWVEGLLAFLREGTAKENNG